MSNKTQLQTNNTNLDTLIARVNTAKDTAASLPEVGSSENLSAELTEQANLIAQQQTLISNLETALENKAGGSGGSGSIETCTVTFSLREGVREPPVDETIIVYIGSDSSPHVESFDYGTVISVQKGSIFAICGLSSTAIYFTNVTPLYQYYSTALCQALNDCEISY